MPRMRSSHQSIKSLATWLVGGSCSRRELLQVITTPHCRSRCGCRSVCLVQASTNMHLQEFQNNSIPSVDDSPKVWHSFISSQLQIDNDELTGRILARVAEKSTE